MVTTSPFAGQAAYGIDFSNTGTSGVFTLGLTAHDQGGNQYVYVFADTEAITQYSLVTVGTDGVAVMADASGNRVDAFAHVAIPLDEYGWVAVKGDFTNVPVNGSVVLNSKLQWDSNSTGQMKPVSTTTGEEAIRAFCLSTPASNAATVRFV